MNTLAELLLHHANNPVAFAEIKTVMVKLMRGEHPDSDDMAKLALAYQRDPIMCTLDYQELEEQIQERFS